MQQTTATKVSDIKREWYFFDVKDQILGRQASQIAQLLMGKAKPYFVKNLDCGDYVVIINAKEVKATGNKETKKVYNRHSMYPGGFKSESLEELRARKPEEIIRRAVRGMLPDNKLRDMMLTRLFIFSGETHNYTDKKFINVK
ncbi:MAG TPA: 50S ribosomal protein L13 [Patescibacteria group bacterium]|nr:50S ribosomal protein L13 [Patescibacteria group bacterium]